MVPVFMIIKKYMEILRQSNKWLAFEILALSPHKFFGQRVSSFTSCLYTYMTVNFHSFYHVGNTS